MVVSINKIKLTIDSNHARLIKPVVLITGSVVDASKRGRLSLTDVTIAALTSGSFLQLDSPLISEDAGKLTLVGCTFQTIITAACSILAILQDANQFAMSKGSFIIRLRLVVAGRV